MVTSTIEPEVIQLDYVKNGQAYILIHWDIEQIEKETEMGTETLWQYEEGIIKDWALPESYASFEEVETYLNSISDELLGWAKGSKVKLKRNK